MKNKMFNEIIVNSCKIEKRIAVLENHKLVELYTERVEKQLIVGNIYKGIIKNLLPGMGAAFIDIGLNRTAFLSYKDIYPIFIDSKIKMSRNSAEISKILSLGQEITVQIRKGPIGQKGARVTCKLTIPGKFLIFMPFQKKIAISRKINSKTERERIKRILDKIKDPDVGLIVRTDTSGISDDEFLQEYTNLDKTWKLIEKQMKYAKAPECLFEENDLSFTLIRDLFNSEIDRLVLDDKKLKNQIILRLKETNPSLISRIELYSENSPIFDAYGIEKEISKIFESRIYLPSGGNICIEHTEALTTIDVNTGSFTGKNNYEETIKQTNLEAAYEIALQIRLRDISGIIVIDFIDMRVSKNQEEVYQLLKSNLKRDREKSKVYPFSPLGLVEISRKRARPSLMVVNSEQCPYCNGSGRVLSRDSVAVRITRWLQRARYFIHNEPLKIYVHPTVKDFLEKNNHLKKNKENKLELVSDPQIGIDKFKVYSTVTYQEITEKYNT